MAPSRGPDKDSRGAALLSPDEPGPFQVLNPLAEAPILLVCDHASCRLPVSLGNMGLDPFARRCHLAVDIGAGPLTEQLAASLGVTAVVARYSRLVVDLNRQLMDASAFLEYGDGILISGNRNLRPADKNLRADTLYWPYHKAVDVEPKARNAERSCLRTCSGPCIWRLRIKTGETPKWVTLWSSASFQTRSTCGKSGAPS